jgi:hypothetical protein
MGKEQEPILSKTVGSGDRLIVKTACIDRMGCASALPFLFQKVTSEGV